MVSNYTQIQAPWHLVGLGAIGTLIGCKLSLSGLPLHCIVKNNMQAALCRKQGLTVHINNQTHHGQPKAVESISSGTTPIDQLIVCCKSYDVAQVLKQLSPRLVQKCLIILIYNGLGVLEEIQNFRQDLRIIQGLSTLGAYREGPFVAHAFTGGNLNLGPLTNSFSSHEINSIQSAFRKAHLACEWHENVLPQMWLKFAVNCSINLLTVLNHCKNGALLAHKSMLKQLTEEIELVMKLCNKPLPTKSLFNLVVNVIENTADNYSSMQQDTQYKRRTEIYYLNEHLVQLARDKGIPTPVNDALLRHYNTRQ